MNLFLCHMLVVPCSRTDPMHLHLVLFALAKRQIIRKQTSVKHFDLGLSFSRPKVQRNHDYKNVTYFLSALEQTLCTCILYIIMKTRRK